LANGFAGEGHLARAFRTHWRLAPRPFHELVRAKNGLLRRGAVAIERLVKDAASRASIGASAT
jgi:hypothetical protein